MGARSGTVTTIAVVPGDKCPRAREFYALAATFLADARCLGKSNRHVPSQYILYIYSIELSLKAYLSSRGYSDRKLKNISHDLQKLLLKAEEEAFGRTGSNTDHVLSVLNQYAKGTSLRYELSSCLPNWDEVDSVAQRILNAAEVALQTTKTEPVENEP